MIPPLYSTAAHRPILFSDNALSWLRTFSVTTWSYCPTCGYLCIDKDNGRRKNPAVRLPCKVDCRYDCYRQRDLETQGIDSSGGMAAMLRRNKRQEWHLQFFPSRYEPKWSYCQPQREDWPVYDADAGVYVEWSTATSHLESMLELDERACLELRCIELFQRCARERGKSKKAPQGSVLLQRVLLQSRRREHQLLHSTSRLNLMRLRSTSRLHQAVVT